jgi:hypothetical protein
VPGSEKLRLRATKLFLEPLKAAGIRHAYREINDRWILADLVLPHKVEFDKYGIPPFVPPDLSEGEIEALPKAPPIEIVVKRFLTGTTKHGCLGMAGSTVRSSHSAYEHLPLEGDGALPEMIVRFDWRNPLHDPVRLERAVRQAGARSDDIVRAVGAALSGEPGFGARVMSELFRHPEAVQGLTSFFAEQVFGLERVADVVLPAQVAEWYIDTARARQTAFMTGMVLEQFLADHDIVFYDLCLFITEDGEMVYGEISQDCGRYRHVDLGELDKDAWRAGGSSDRVLEKWNMLLTLLQDDSVLGVERSSAAAYESVLRSVLQDGAEGRQA